ncbi:MAG TPA: shikimate dehydrogenase [Chloroflexota bacterium]|nr:shikimate dehydrogenase [Chloroflexota bacterium]
MTLQAGVIGYPLHHSISPQFQQPAFDHLGLDVRYAARETPPERLPSFLDELRAGGWLGCNVTIPHKLAVFDGVDALTDEAREIGAVNTVIVEGGRLLGHNTDAEGFMRALRAEAGFDVRGKEVVLLGAGGAALAVAVGLARAGVKRLWIANRTPARAEALAQRLEGRTDARALPPHPAALVQALRDAQLLVNSTSVGMSSGPAPSDLPLPEALLGPHLLVYDLVYNPAVTPLLAAASRVGARTLEGLPMLVYQGAASFERWTGKPAPTTIMMEAARRALREREGPSELASEALRNTVRGSGGAQRPLAARNE